jgi:hypothetical protein
MQRGRRLVKLVYQTKVLCCSRLQAADIQGGVHGQASDFGATSGDAGSAVSQTTDQRLATRDSRLEL